MFCREQCARLVERQGDIEARGAQLIAIGNGRAEWARAFIEAEGVDFPVFVDPSRQSYDAFGMKRGTSKVMTLRGVGHATRATTQGFRQTATRGDPLQIGGVVVFDADGEILYTHVEEEAGDLADIDEVLAALD
jgi:hypothetical protein